MNEKFTISFQGILFSLGPIMKQTRLLEKAVLVSRRIIYAGCVSSRRGSASDNNVFSQRRPRGCRWLEKGVYKKELNSFDWLNVKTEMWENTLDVSKEEISPGKDVMVKKPVGCGTHLKKGRVVVCAKFPTSTTWRGCVQTHRHF